MDVVSVVQIIIGLAASVPVVGTYLAIVLPYALALPLLVTSFVALWHAIVVFLSAVGAIPGLSSLSALGVKLSADEQIISDFSQSKLLPILNQLSAIPLPKK
jgi:hypothetical protein